MKKGIIFDMDGTLWDSAENVAKSWNLAIQKSGVLDKTLTTADIQGVMGKTMDAIADILFSELAKETRMRLLEECCAMENDYLREHGGMLYNGVKETLSALRARDYHLSIVSNCQAGYIEAFLDYYKFHDLFDDIECFGNNNKQKNENISLIVERNQLERAVYVGDIQGDYDATMKAGLPFIHAAYGFGKVEAEVVRIKALRELPDVIGQVI